MQTDVIERALTMLSDKYIFPEKAAEAAAAVRTNLKSGAYAGLTDAELAERITAELQAVCADKHLRLRIRAADTRTAFTEDELEAAWQEKQRLGGYGIAKVERLAGNVGYLDLRGIPDVSVGGRAIAAAMELLAHTHALIVDLRRNRGGDPDGVQFWCSFLFPDGETHLNSIYDGPTGQTRGYWTLPYVPGPRYLDRPVYVLTSAFTFSAAEEFAYNLQVLKRAVLIGETTRGGAHPTGVFPLTGSLEITIPTARAINPVTGTNWEAVGVEPDVAVPADEAFPRAYRRALDHVLTLATADSVLTEAREALSAP
jgi:C-terminal processing protease CtpA/Prc